MHDRHATGIRRRTFLIAGGGGLAALSLGLWGLGPRVAEAKEDKSGASVLNSATPAYSDWADIYREQWRWDRVARGTHSSANCIAACAWNLYVRDNLVWREEQAAPYVASNETVPDWNPRGCQKGACYSNLSVGPTRVTHPLKRVGKRGEGRWKRISWDEALGEIASTFVDVLAKRGGGGAICEFGGHLDYGPTMISALRFFRQIGVPVTDATPMVGDLPAGATITFGDPFIGGSSDDWFRSDYLVLWAFNPSATRIPDSHYLNEARYRGARVVSITPDYNQSAIHADLWMGVRPGTDAALAMAACNVVVEEKLYRADYVREQTDLPFLVRDDTHRFLRQSDVVGGGKDNLFAVWDGSKPVWASGCEGSDQKTLKMPDGVQAELEARAEVKLASGEKVGVRTVFSLLRDSLAQFSPEKAAAITGVSASVIRTFARDFAKARAALILAQFGMCKNYHSDLAQRAQILLASLTGNPGKAGAGWQSGSFIALDGMGLVAMQDKLDMPHLMWLGAQAYMNPAEVRSRFEKIFVSSTLFHAWHGKLAKVQAAAANGDPALPEGAEPYLREAIEKGHFPIGAPMDGPPPEVFLCLNGNVLRHSRMGARLRDGLFADARLIVDLSMRMSETALHADILLPAAGWYEKVGIKYIPALTPYVTISDKAVEPLGESKSEWEIFALLADRIAVEARRRGVLEVKGFRGNSCELGNLGERFTDGGRFGPLDAEKVLEFILSMSKATKGIKMDDLRRDGGAKRLTALSAGIHSDYSVHEPVAPLRDCIEKKTPYPTLTGRQQFYVDHPWFLRLGEQLPTHKDPPAAGGNHPFTMTGGHTRWSIHAVWRDHALLLRLQRGEPVVFVNPADAQNLGIADHDPIRVWNDVGTFEAHAKVAGSIRPGQVHIFHAWEPFQFRTRDSHQALIPSPIKVTQLVGDYGQLHWGMAHYEPNQTDRDTRVSVARA